MIDIKTQQTDEQLSVSFQQALPVSPFPRKYVHCVVDNLQDALQAVEALRAAGYDAKDIHLMTGQDFVKAVEQGSQQPGGLFQTLTHYLLDYGFDDMYLGEARQGRYILSVRPAGFEQIRHVRDLLAAHHAHLAKYIDTWTFADLLP